MLTISLRSLCAGASLAAITLALATPSAAFAQATEQTPESQTEDAGQQATAEEVAGPLETPEDAEAEIVVTGSRIARPEFDTPNPITSFTAASIEQSGLTNVTDFLVQNPALIGSSTSADNSGSNAGFGTTGINLLNLRNLGTNRTLVLVDGRRHVSGLPGSAAVDINTIPTDLIERVDVVTGGASAVYGADAVSGVVNFVLKRNFDGISARGQAGISEQGDTGNRFGSVTVGKNFAGDRANVAVSYEFSEEDRVNSFDRRRTGDPLFSFSLVRDPGDIPDVAGRPDRVLTNNLRYADSSTDGAIDIDFDGIPEFTGTGAVYDRGRLLPSSNGLTQGGSSTPLAGYQGDLRGKTRRHNVNVLTSFEVSDALRVFAQGKYVDTLGFSIAQPTFDFFTYITPENPFIPINIAAVAPDGVLLSRDNFDLGVRGETVKRETLRGVVGADGRISPNARYEVSYVYGQTKTNNRSDNFRLSDRYFAALDAVIDPATGRPTCRSNLTPAGNIDPNNFDAPATTFRPGAGSGCAPINFFGENVISQAALDFVTVDLINLSKVSQNVVSGSISGDFGGQFELPGGPVRFAIGAEYREEKSRFVSDPFLQTGEVADIGQILPESGSFDVKEVFAELNVPILADLPFAETLSFGAAVRLSDYSTVGTTTTWKLDGIYAPIRDISFRGTYSKAVRAPNVSELFSPINGTFAFIDDPCDPINLPEGTSTRVANCNAALTALGINPGTFNPVNDPTATVSLPGRAGGNRELGEEEATSWTAGAVLRPSFLRGFTASFDWYDIELKDAVNTASAQDIVDLCVDQPTLDNVFCDAITRDPQTGFISDFFVAPQNVAEFETSGADLNLNYRFAPSATFGTFNLRVVANYLDTLSFVPTIGADVDIDRGEAFAPKYSGTADLTWTRGPVTLNYGVNYFSRTRRFTTEQTDANPDIADPSLIFFKRRLEHDFQGSVRAGEAFSFYAGVNNLSNEKPSPGSASYPVSFIGRYFYAGARIRFNAPF